VQRKCLCAALILLSRREFAPEAAHVDDEAVALFAIEILELAGSLNRSLKWRTLFLLLL